MLKKSEMGVARFVGVASREFKKFASNFSVVNFKGCSN